jgi:segregation and condensation protein A
VGYKVSTPVFEGPFDLLLHLVTRDQVDIWELSLFSIVDEFVASIEQMQALDLSVATEFLLTAAVLLELKARRLLPDSGDADNEEILALWEERDLLLARLLECKTFKEASLAMNRLMESAQRSVPRRAGLEERFVGLAPDLLEGVTASDLKTAMAKLLTPKPAPRVNTEHVAPVRASVAEVVDELVTRLPGEGRTTFRRLVEGVTERLEVIVYFLALLELYKRGALDLEQAGKLADLHINWLGLDAADLDEPAFGVPYLGEPDRGERDLDRPDLDEPGMDEPGMDEAGMEGAGVEETGVEETGRDEIGRDEIGRGQAGADAVGPGPAPWRVRSEIDLVSEYEG